MLTSSSLISRTRSWTSCRCLEDIRFGRRVAVALTSLLERSSQGLFYLQTNPVVVLARSANLSPETQAFLTSAHKHKASPYPFFSPDRYDGEVKPEH